MHLRWDVAPLKEGSWCFAFYILSSWLKGTRAMEGNEYFPQHYFVHLHRGRPTATPRHSTCDWNRGCRWWGRGGCGVPSSRQVGVAQTCVEPSGLCESCQSRLTSSPLSRIQTLGQGTPSWFCLLRILHQQKSLLEQVSVQLGDQANPGALETSPSSREKVANAKQAESAPTLPFHRSETRDLRDSASPVPPTHLPRNPHILVTPCGFLIYSQVQGVGTTQTGASPVHDDLQRLISVLIK